MPGRDDLVSRLYFGRDDAERDMADGLLRSGFLPTRAYEEAWSGRKTLVIGRKGSGKSAICMQLAASAARSGGASVITPDDAAGEELRRFELQGLNVPVAKSLIWRYVFAIQAARYLVGHARAGHGNVNAKSVRTLGKFLKQNGEAGDDRFYDRVLKGISGLQTSISLEAFGVKGSVDFAKGQSEGARASRQLEVIELGVARAFTDMGCARRHAPFLILVDQVEQIWSGDSGSGAMVKGLLLAGHHAAGTVYGGAVRCVLFLRSDIYDVLDFGEGDKFHGDEMRIEWTINQLCEVALLRARTSLGVNLTDAQLWGGVFPGAVNGEAVRQYLFDRVLPRPRDVIQFLTACRDQAKGRGHRRVAEGDVVDATRQFSAWKLQDLTREYQVNYPFLARLFVMFQNTGYIVTRVGMNMRLEVHLETLRQLYPEYVGAFTSQGLLDILYGIGFLGVKRGIDVVYVGTGQAGIQVSENEFHVHPCFRAALNAVVPTGIDSYEKARREDSWLSAKGTQVAIGSIFTNISGLDVAVGYGRGVHLLDSLAEACTRILRLLVRSGLPADTGNQVGAEIGHILRAAAEVRESFNRHESGETPLEYVIKTASYLNSLATQLVQNGVADNDQGRGLVRAIQDEASGLIREAGGGYVPR